MEDPYNDTQIVNSMLRKKQRVYITVGFAIKNVGILTKLVKCADCYKASHPGNLDCMIAILGLTLVS